MGATSSKTKEAVIKTKVRAVGKLSYVRKQSNARRQEQEELRRRRGEAISVFDDSSEGDISREDITSLPLKNGGQVSDGERNEAFSVTDISTNIDGENEVNRKVGLSLSDFKRVTRKKTLDEADAFFSVPYDAMENVVSSDHCHVCEVFTGHEVYPCRICGRAFHKSCLQKLGRCQTQLEVSELHSAKTSVGWSCYYCNDLSYLLTEEELSTLMETFDLLDINKDSSLSKEEFLRFYDRKDEKGDSSIENLTEAELKFSLVDRDKSGTISWTEFLNCETIFMLQRRNKSTLVPLLSGSERELARHVFKHFDTDHDETITTYEAKAALELWYSLFYTPDGLQNGYSLLSNPNRLRTVFENANTDEENEIDENNTIKDTYTDEYAILSNNDRLQLVIENGNAVEGKETDENDTNEEKDTDEYPMLSNSDRLQTVSENGNAKEDKETDENSTTEENDTEGTMSWEEFIKDMAIHAIAMRPNKCQIPVGHLEWLRSMVSEINKTPTTATLRVPGDGNDSDSSGLSNSSINQLL